MAVVLIGARVGQLGRASSDRSPRRSGYFFWPPGFAASTLSISANRASPSKILRVVHLAIRAEKRKARRRPPRLLAGAQRARRRQQEKSEETHRNTLANGSFQRSAVSDHQTRFGLSLIAYSLKAYR